jgi:hypothetical protein
MSLDRVRFVGGALQGKVMWVEPSCTTLDVHIGGQNPGESKTLHYRRSGAVLHYVSETLTVATEPVAASSAPDQLSPRGLRQEAIHEPGH